MYTYFIEPFFSLLCMVFFLFAKSTRLILCFSAILTMNCYEYVWIMPAVFAVYCRLSWCTLTV